MKRFSSFVSALLLLLLLARFAAHSQSVSIGTSSPAASAALEVSSTGKGFLPPRLTYAQRTGISNAVAGLLVFQSDLAASPPQPNGYYYYSGTQWLPLLSQGDNLGNHTATQNLNLGTQALTGTGARVGTAVGVGVRADGGLNLGQNGLGNNVLLGSEAGQNLTPTTSFLRGFANHFSGVSAGWLTTTGSFNLFNGTQSGLRNTTGSSNTFVGAFSGEDNTTGSNNWLFGFGASLDANNLTNAGAIGYLAQVSQSNSLALGATGSNAVNVGIGTAAPAERLHLYGPGVTVLRLQSSSGFSPAGVEFWSDPQNSPSEWRPSFMRSTDADGFTDGLAFFTNGSGSANRTAVVEQMRIPNGGVAIGTTTLNAHCLNVAGTVGATAFATTSDPRLKQHIRPLTGALAGVLALRGVRYEWNAEGVRRGGTAGQLQIGLLAQQVEKVYPELVVTAPNGYKSVNYAQLTPVLLGAVRELHAQLTESQAAIADLRRRVRALEADEVRQRGTGRSVARLRP